MLNNTRTTITRVAGTSAPEARGGEIPAIVFGEIMYAARCAHELGDTDRARGIAEAGEILSGISADVLLARLA
jgi:hypothetical protein